VVYSVKAFLDNVHLTDMTYKNSLCVCKTNSGFWLEEMEKVLEKVKAKHTSIWEASDILNASTSLHSWHSVDCDVAGNSTPICDKLPTCIGLKQMR